VEKTAEPVAADAVLGDRRSMLWSGTLVTQGTARGLVVATGRATEIGRIAGLLAGVEQLTTPLVAQMDHFARWLSFLILLVAALLLVYGYFVGHHDRDREANQAWASPLEGPQCRRVRETGA
jgi:magnesium-transporting ATPase (P-type)